ncbi:MAG: efflux RND transporter periplasmic adaptor subunit [Candidatus Uhrbacteria bacterium]
MTHRRIFFYVAAAATIVTVGVVVLVLIKQRPDSDYDVVTVQRRDLVREITVTGRIKAADEVELAFEVAGRIARRPVDVGAAVVSGAELVALDDADLRAALAQRRAALAIEGARLAELRAGTRPEEIQMAEVDVANAQRALTNAETESVGVRAKADVDLAVLYDDVKDVLRDAYTTADDAVRKQTDDLFTNDATDNPQISFQTSNFQAEIDAERERRRAEEALRAWSAAIDNLPVDQPGRDAMLSDAITKLDTISEFLEKTTMAVNGATNLSSATLAAYKVSINAGRTNVVTAQTSVSGLKQSIATQVATNRNSLATTEAAATTRRNTLAATESKLTLLRAGATREQIRAQEARVVSAAADVDQAEARLAKTVLRAPFAGIITIQDAKVGALAMAGTPLTTLIASSGYESEVDVPEAELSDLAVGQTAVVTLDAYGSDVKLAAKVTAIDPAASIIEGVPTYRTTLTFEKQDERIRAGLTANVIIMAGQRSNVLVLPQRAVSGRNGDQFVRILDEGVVREMAVHTGFRGSDGYVEITEGLVEGQAVIRSVRSQ